ncbi:MAG: HlyC/CorC family transporter [Acidobacteria bacterium]|nr:MAG: HlyC/CorC family transporter [Acidobacteriota bacterium]
MVDSHYGFRIVILILIIAVNAFFAAAEVALVSVRESRLRQLAESGQAGAQAALNLLANPERLLSVTQMGVTLASLGLGWAGEDTLYQMVVALLHPVITPVTEKALHVASFILAFLVMSYFHVVVGEVVPKNLAIDNADRLAVIVAPALLLFYRISEPFVWIIEKSSSWIIETVGTKSQERGGGHSAEELKLIVSSSRGLGHLPQMQEDIIHRVLDLDNVYVREIMVPRNDIISIPVDASLEQVMQTVAEHQHSRLPVYEERPEQIVGLLYYKDLLPVWEEHRAAVLTGRPTRMFRVRRLMRKHLVVPETKPVSQMLAEFQQGRSHMAMVVDEFGTIVGLVTVEDVLEQVVGEIGDEFDVKPERPAAETDELELEGATKIRDIEGQYGVELPSNGGFETLAGFMLMKLGNIPKLGEAVEHDGRRFTVLEMDRNRIAKVRIEKVGQ